MPPRGRRESRRAAWARFVVLTWRAWAASLLPGIKLFLPGGTHRPRARLPVNESDADGDLPEEDETPTCQACKKPMILRANRTDRGLFWGCADFPRCAATRRYGGGRVHIEPDELTPTQVRQMDKPVLGAYASFLGLTVGRKTKLELREEILELVGPTPAGRKKTQSASQLKKMRKADLQQMAANYDLDLMDLNGKDKTRDRLIYELLRERRRREEEAPRGASPTRPTRRTSEARSTRPTRGTPGDLTPSSESFDMEDS